MVLPDVDVQVHELNSNSNHKGNIAYLGTYLSQEGLSEVAKPNQTEVTELIGIDTQLVSMRVGS